MADESAMPPEDRKESPWRIAKQNASKIADRFALIARPAIKLSPDKWATANRIVPPSGAIPGPIDPTITPYMMPFAASVAGRKYKRVVVTCGAQMGKTDTMLSIIGHGLDQYPTPTLYVGPNRQFLLEQFEPRVSAMLEDAPALRGKLASARKMTKSLKWVAGVPLRLAHAGSSTALKSDPAGLALVDEYDEMLANVKGQGDPLGLVEARGDTYLDFCAVITSTPSQGLIETEIDEGSGLEFWAQADEDDISSPIWRLWQEGTRHHWCWPCPHCAEYFVPRFKQLRYPKNATPFQALRSAWLECPRCSGKIEETHKAEMNARGVFVAPGQMVTPDGSIVGEPVESTTLSFWVSGLCSPFKSFGERAEIYLTALATNESAKIQTAMNAGFGEVYVPGGGDVPEWQEIARRKESYAARTLPEGVRFLVAGIDVQANRLPYVIRGFGAMAESWLIEHGEVWGRTSELKVWDDLATLLGQNYDGLPIKLAFIDSGFRPGKKESLPIHRVYDFCRTHKRFVIPTKGSSTPMVRPLIMAAIEVEQANGKGRKYGLQLARLDSDFFKALVHERLTFASDQPGAFHLNAHVTDDYCQQLVAEARVKGPSGKWVWVPRSKENHFLDAESLAAAAAYRIGAENLKAAPRPHPRPTAALPRPPVVIDEYDDDPPTPPAPAVIPARSVRDRFGSFASRLNR